MQRVPLWTTSNTTRAALLLLATRHARIVDSEHVARLRAAKLVESRVKPRLRVSQDIAKRTGKMPDNLRKKPQAGTH